MRQTRRQHCGRKLAWLYLPCLETTFDVRLWIQWQIPPKRIYVTASQSLPSVVVTSRPAKKLQTSILLFFFLMAGLCCWCDIARQHSSNSSALDLSGFTLRSRDGVCFCLRYFPCVDVRRQRLYRQGSSNQSVDLLQRHSVTNRTLSPRAKSNDWPYSCQHRAAVNA